MSLGDAIADALPRLQAQAESMMRELCVVHRPGGPAKRGEIDPATGVRGPDTTPMDVVYAGRWKRQQNALVDRDSDVAGDSVSTNRLTGHFPVSQCVRDGFPIFREGDIVFAGRRQGSAIVPVTERAWRITSVADKTHQTALRLPIEQHAWR